MSSPLTESVGAKQVEIVIDGAERLVPAGVSVAVALLLARADATAPSRTVFCGMGSCYECVAVVNGVPGVRTCITPVADHMRVDTRGTGNDA